MYLTTKQNHQDEKEPYDAIMPTIDKHWSICSKRPD